MASNELSLSLQDKIKVITGKARECFSNKDYVGFIKFQKQKWDIIPSPKEYWEESYRVCKVLITFYIKYNVDFVEARRWLTELDRLDKIQKQHPGEVSLMEGKFYFEKREYHEAYDFFDRAFKESEGRCFGHKDSEYESFYLEDHLDLLKKK